MSKLFKLIEVDPKSIKLKERARKTLGDLTTLKDSIKESGLLNPILITPEFYLIAGQRRLQVCLDLKLDKIATRIIPDLTEDQEMLIERIENVARKDFLWNEELMLRYKIHLHWESNRKDWSLRKTAIEFKCSVGGLSSDFFLAQGINDLPHLQLDRIESKSKAKEVYKKAINQVQASIAVENLPEEEQKRLSDLMEGKVSITIDPENSPENKPRAIHKDTNPQVERNNECSHCEHPVSSVKMERPKIIYSIENYDTFIHKVPDNSVGLVELDPPYAIDFENTYRKIDKAKVTVSDWTSETLYNFYDTMLPLLYNKLIDDSWILCWTGKEHWIKTNEIAMRNNFIVQDPGIWYKPGGGSSNKPNYVMVNCYETFLLFRKGKATFNTPQLSSVIEFNSVSGGNKIHQWEKPLEMYNYFLNVLGKPNSLFLTLFAGSGNSMIAAALNKMIPIGCDVSQEYIYSFYERLDKYFLLNESK